jgi:hypothetical protein
MGALVRCTVLILAISALVGKIETSGEPDGCLADAWSGLLPAFDASTCCDYPRAPDRRLRGFW